MPRFDTYIATEHLPTSLPELPPYRDASKVRDISVTLRHLPIYRTPTYLPDLPPYLDASSVTDISVTLRHLPSYRTPTYLPTGLTSLPPSLDASSVTDISVTLRHLRSIFKIVDYQRKNRRFSFNSSKSSIFKGKPLEN